MSAENVFVDNLEPVAFWCLRYQSPGWCMYFMEDSCYCWVALF